MGNCSLRAVADAAPGQNGEKTSSTPNGFRMKTVSTKRGNGVWKVKMVISPKDLEVILSEGANTEALIQHMRTTAANSTPVGGKNSCNGFNHKLAC